MVSLGEEESCDLTTTSVKVVKGGNSFFSLGMRQLVNAASSFRQCDADMVGRLRHNAVRKWETRCVLPRVWRAVPQVDCTYTRLILARFHYDRASCPSQQKSQRAKCTLSVLAVNYLRLRNGQSRFSCCRLSKEHDGGLEGQTGRSRSIAQEACCIIAPNGAHMILIRRPSLETMIMSVMSTLCTLKKHSPTSIQYYLSYHPSYSCQYAP
jgi:hypothetical protein